ncbi:hypothetical protein FB451DRAFT_1182485 [Mycena latifolia]|nr:hypothetical protein FB451DRAFT_1182485 [Mycena latifolia]
MTVGVRAAVPFTQWPTPRGAGLERFYPAYHSSFRRQNQGPRREQNDASNIPAAGKFVGGRRWPPVIIGGQRRTLCANRHTRGIPGSPDLNWPLNSSGIQGMPAENAEEDIIILMYDHETCLDSPAQVVH